MDNLRVWSMRLGAAGLLAVGVLSLAAVLDPRLSIPLFSGERLDRRSIATVVLTAFLLVAGVITAFASSRRHSESTQRRVGAAVLLALGVAMFAAFHVFQDGA